MPNGRLEVYHITNTHNWWGTCAISFPLQSSANWAQSLNREQLQTDHPFVWGWVSHTELGRKTVQTSDSDDESEVNLLFFAPESLSVWPTRQGWKFGFSKSVVLTCGNPYHWHKQGMWGTSLKTEKLIKRSSAARMYAGKRNHPYFRTLEQIAYLFT